MSRFANLSATREVDLGPCQCPNSPHPRDLVTIRTELGYGAQTIIGEAAARPEGVVIWGAARLKILEFGVVSWNLLDHEGKAVEPGAMAYALLDQDTVETIAQAINDAVLEGRLPNGSGAPSAGSSLGSASSIPTADPTPSSPTTS